MDQWGMETEEVAGGAVADDPGNGAWTEAEIIVVGGMGMGIVHRGRGESHGKDRENCDHPEQGNDTQSG